MAVDLGSLVSEVKEAITLEDLSGKIISIDAYNTIYQFLSIIRGPDGTPLSDSKNRVTSHLSGLFYRTISLIENKITPVFIFDGIPPALKRRTLEARMTRRNEATKAWENAVEKGMVEEARAYAVASTRINKDIVASAKELLGLMGVPYMQAPSEGEAQACRMTNEGVAYAAASQDYDSFLFGAEVVIRNLTLSGRRKLPKRDIYVNVNIERTKTADLLKKFGLDRRMLIMAGALIGTDYNEGIEKVGPKTALKIVKEHKTKEKVCSYVKEKYNLDMESELNDVIKLFEEPETVSVSHKTMDDMIKESRVNSEGIMKFMCGEHEFSEERISKYVEKLVGLREEPRQKGINTWM